MPEGIRLVTQGEIVAESLASYLKRHTDLERRLHKATSPDSGMKFILPGAPLQAENTGSCEFITTENSIKFSQMASLFLGRPVTATSIEI